MVNILSNKELQTLLPKQKIPLFSSYVRAGFPSPADDFLEKKIDLNDYLIKNRSATFLVRVQGDSMMNDHIHDGDILVVDRSLEAMNKDIVIAAVNGEFTVKRLIKGKNTIVLKAANPLYKDIVLTSGSDARICGVVIFSILHHRNR